MNAVDYYPTDGTRLTSDPATSRDGSPPPVDTLPSSQTLRRGLDILDLLGADGPLPLRELGASTGLSRSTAARLAAALISRDFVRSSPRGYSLGPKLMALADRARQQRPLTLVARPPSGAAGGR